MAIDFNSKAIELCEKIANSFCDRNETPVFFSKKEIELVREWITNTINESKESMGDY
jgi:hypothetical protein